MLKHYKSISIDGKIKRLHRVLAEAALGKPLPKGVEVHHVDCTKSERSPLVICENHSYHILLHVRTRVLRAGGNPNTDTICCECRSVKPNSEFYKPRGNQCKQCCKTRRSLYRATHLEEVRAYEAGRRIAARKARQQEVQS